jgi:broad specificity phosphatase PhoE
MRIDAVQRQHAVVWERNAAQDDDDFGWPGGETYRQFRARVLATLERIAISHPAKRIAVVTHAGVIAQVVGQIRGRRSAEWEPDRPDPLTATEITWHRGKPQTVMSFNDPAWF